MEFSNRVTNFELLNSEFDLLQTGIEELVALKDFPEEYKERKKFSDTFYKLQSTAKVILSKQKSNTDGQSCTSLSYQDFNVKLPQIHLPKFADDSETWLVFRDTYVILIHDNTSLSNIQ